jgi:hypothetical protein
MLVINLPKEFRFPESVAMTRSRLLKTSIAFLISLTVGILPSIADTPPDLQFAAAQPALVHVSGDTIYYQGNLSESSTSAFRAAVAGIKRGQLTRLVISSVGGDTRAGIEIGTWVHDMSLVVEVEKICFSSCANYIFPAGSSKVIRTNAFVGWHGNVRGAAIEAEQRGVTLQSEYKKVLPSEILEGPPEALAEAVAQLMDSATKSATEEAKYFSLLGLNDAFSVCAVGDVSSAKVPDLKDKRGWGFSVEDMNRLGLKNTTYLGDGAYEKNSAYFVKYLALLSAADCLSLLK